MADRSIKYPLGVLDDVVIKIDKFSFSADFIVLDMEEDRNVPLILGRPFLAIGRTLIDVEKGELIFRVQDEQVTFKIFKAMQQPSNVENNFKIDTKDKQVVEAPEEELKNKPKKCQVYKIWKNKSWKAKFLLESCTAKLNMEESPKDCKKLIEANTFHPWASMKYNRKSR